MRRFLWLQLVRMRDVNLPPCEVICCWLEACSCLAQDAAAETRFANGGAAQLPSLDPASIVGENARGLDAQDQSRDRCVG
jgi:hypothetical protein